MNLLDGATAIGFSCWLKEHHPGAVQTAGNVITVTNPNGLQFALTVNILAKPGTDLTEFER